MLAKDRDGAYVFLPESEWMMRKTMEDHPDVKFNQRVSSAVCSQEREPGTRHRLVAKGRAR